MAGPLHLSEGNEELPVIVGENEWLAPTLLSQHVAAPLRFDQCTFCWDGANTNV